MTIPVALAAPTFVVLSACVSALAVRGIRGFARERRLVDIPNERSSHTRPVPRGGGAAIALVVIAGGAAAAGFAAPTSTLLPVLAGGACIAGLGLADDIWGLSAAFRLLMHFVIGGFTVIALGEIKAVPLPGVGVVELGRLAIPLTTLWVVGLINAYNFMDGIDGLAGGQAVVAAAAWAIAAHLKGQDDLALFAWSVLGASAGFLVFNWSPASIFMGDVGSAFLGYLFAVFPLLVDRQGIPGFLAPLAVAPLLPFLGDTTFTLFRRLSRGENIIMAHRSHVYQRLVQSKWTHDQVAAGYILVSGVGACVGLVASVGKGTVTLAAIGILLPVAVAWIVVWSKHREARAGSLQ